MAKPKTTVKTNMDVTRALHPMYKKFALSRTKIRDVIDGAEAINDAGVAYLPKLKGQTDEEYAAYKSRALFMNITARIVNTNIGMMTRRSPTISFPERMRSYFEDTLDNIAFIELYRFLVRELLTIGHVGVYLDIVDNKPTPVRVKSDDLVNWTFKDGILNNVVIRIESSSDNDLLHTKIVTHYHLYLDIDGVFKVDEYEDEELLGTTIPTIKGQTLKFIPIIVGTPFSIDIEPIRSPIQDIAEINLSHYRTSADLEHGRHFTALPTPVITGGKPDAKITIGSTKAIVIPEPKAKAFYMEFLGQGLQSLENALKEKQAQMAQFSARLMDTSTRGSEAEGTVRLRHAADAATLYDITVAAESILNNVYKMIATWLGLDVNEVKISLNKDFLETKLSPAELRELVKAFIDGGIDEKILYYNLQRGEITPPKVEDIPA